MRWEDYIQRIDTASGAELLLSHELFLDRPSLLFSAELRIFEIAVQEES